MVRDRPLQVTWIVAAVCPAAGLPPECSFASSGLCHCEPSAATTFFSGVRFASPRGAAPTGAGSPCAVAVYASFLGKMRVDGSGTNRAYQEREPKLEVVVLFAVSTNIIRRSPWLPKPWRRGSRHEEVQD